MVTPLSVASAALSSIPEAEVLPSEVEEEIYGTANTSLRTSEASGRTTNYESVSSIRVPASESRTSVTSSFKSVHTLQASVGDITGAPSSSEYWATPTVPTSSTRSATPRGSTYGTFSERSAEGSTTFATLEPRSNVFYDSAAASVVGTPHWSPSSGASFELPEIPSESQLNSPAMSLGTLGSSEGRMRRRASPALSPVPSVIPSIRSLEDVLPERVRVQPSTAPQVALPLSIPTLQHEPRRVSPSTSPVLSSTMSPLMASTEQNIDVPTPSSLSLSLSLNIEHTATLSLLSPFPRSVTPDASSVATPSSLAIPSDSESDPETLSVSNTSFTQTSTSFQPPASRIKAWASTTDLSYNSSVLHPSPSIPSVTFQEDYEEVHPSFDTSFLRPSSVFSSSPPYSASSPPLRPPGPIPPSTATASSLASLSISSRTGIPPTTRAVTPTSPRISRPLPRVPISLATESLISVSLLGSEPHLPPESSPVAHSRPISTPSSQPSLQHINATGSLSPRRASPAAPPSNGTPSAARSQSTPSGSIIVSVTTPHGSGSTEKPSLGTVPSDHSAVTDDRNIAHDFDRIADEIHTYNLARGLEHEGLMNDVRTLKNEVRGLAGLVRMGPYAATQPLRAQSPAVEHPRETLGVVDRQVGGNSPIYRDVPARVSVGVSAPSSPSGTSEVRSVHSYLSSHHSDDDVLQIEEEMLLPPIHSPLWPVTPLNAKRPATDSSLEVSPESDSSSLSSSPYASSSELSEGWLESVAPPMDPPPLQPQEIRQLPESIERALEGIQNQLHSLDNGQHENVNLLESLQRNPEDEDRQTSELLERLGHIEDLLRTYLEQGQQQKRSPIPSSQKSIDQVPVPSPPPFQKTSISTSDSVDSLQRLRMFMGDIAHHIENDHDRSSQLDRRSMPPLPSTRRQRPNDVLQPLDLNISPPRPPSLPQSEIPRIEPFNFLYGDSIIGRGERPRSTSPMSVDRLPPLRHVASVVLPVPAQVSVPAPKRRRRRREEVGEGEPDRRHLRFTTPDVERLLSKRRIKRDADALRRLQQQNQELQQQRQQQQIQQQQQQQLQAQQPPRQVVLRSALKPYNATPQVSGFQHQVPLPDTNRTRPVPAERTHSDSQVQPRNALPSRTKSWYVRPRDEQGAKRPMSTAFVDPSNLRYLPMASAPTEVAMPSLGPSMNILRDQRLAQLATVDQQRELMKYMKTLNEWMERDTRNRREEFRDVFQTVQDLRRQIKGMRKKGRVNNNNRERDPRDGRREEEARRGSTRSRTRSERPDLPASSPAVTTPVTPHPQRWTAVPALLQPFPVHPQQQRQGQGQQQRLMVPPMIHTTSNSSRHARGSRVSLVPAAIIQQPQTGRAQPPHGQMQAQPTIILLPAGGGRAPPGQAAHSNFHPVDWQYPDQHLERNGTRRSRR